MKDYLLSVFGKAVLDELSGTADLFVASLQEPMFVLFLLLSGSITMIVFFGGTMILASCLMRDWNLFWVNIILMVCGIIIKIILFMCALTDNAIIFGGIMFVFALSWAQIMVWLTTQKTQAFVV